MEKLTTNLPEYCVLVIGHILSKKRYFRANYIKKIFRGFIHDMLFKY